MAGSEKRKRDTSVPADVPTLAGSARECRLATGRAHRGARSKTSLSRHMDNTRYHFSRLLEKIIPLSSYIIWARCTVPLSPNHYPTPADMKSSAFALVLQLIRLSPSFPSHDRCLRWIQLREGKHWPLLGWLRPRCLQRHHHFPLHQAS